MNAESDEERCKRHLDELKGKNVANYSVLLTTVIQSELDSIRSIITLSSAGIGVLFASTKLGESSVTNTVLTILGLLGFGFAVFYGISFQMTASKKYEGNLYTAEDLVNQPDMRASIGTVRAEFKGKRSCAAWSFLFGLGSTVGLGIVGCVSRLL